MLEFPTCESNLTTKYCTSDNKEVGVKNPVEITETYGHQEIKEWLEAIYSSQQHDSLETFQTCGLLNGIILFSVTLAAYKNAFHPTKTDPSLLMIEIMRAIFQDVTTSDDRFKAIRERVLEAVRGEFPAAHSIIESSKTEGRFFYVLNKHLHRRDFVCSFVLAHVRSSSTTERTQVQANRERFGLRTLYIDVSNRPPVLASIEKRKQDYIQASASHE